MKFGSGQTTAPTEVRARLGSGTEINGEVKFNDAFRVDAKLSGKITSDTGNLIISENGHVQATVEVGFVEVYGTVEGTITAKYRVQIHPGGRVYGDIFTPVLNIESGAIFDGKCHMITENRTQEKGKTANSAPLYNEKLTPVPAKG